jgi:hypothetical protein
MAYTMSRSIQVREKSLLSTGYGCIESTSWEAYSSDRYTVITGVEMYAAELDRKDQWINIEINIGVCQHSCY